MAGNKGGGANCIMMNIGSNDDHDDGELNVG